MQSLQRPGGNTTGISILATELDAKRLQVLREALPRSRRIGVLHDPSTFNSLPAVTAAGRALKLDLIFAPVRSATELRAAVDKILAARAEAVNVLASSTLYALRSRLIAEFARLRLPAIYEWPEMAEEGGLIGYGPRITACFRQVAGLVDKILRGAKPADIPVEQPVKFDLVINNTTAKAIGLIIPEQFLLRADEVIE